MGIDTLKGGGTLYNIQGGPDTNKGEGDKHYKKGGDGQYTGRKHIKNMSIQLTELVLLLLGAQDRH